MGDVPQNGIDCTNPANKNDPVCQNEATILTKFAIIFLVLLFVFLIIAAIWLYLKYYRPLPYVKRLPPLYCS